jgi:nitrate/TMAO reductase-like tetraheme cytochrome c subunit
VRRFFAWLFAPSARWSIFALVFAGVVIGFVGVVGTQVAVAVTGSTEFCGNSCHSHEKFVYPEYKASVHASNRSGVKAGCGDCHIPHSYPAKLLYKAEAGLRDGLAEMRGVISTQEKFEAQRWRMANHVWDEMKANNSANCRTCHTPEAMNTAKQSEDAVKQHKKFTAGKATCIECHTGVAHKEPEEPKAPAKAASQP